MIFPNGPDIKGYQTGLSNVGPDKIYNAIAKGPSKVQINDV